jgi:putative peptidoglycan lipid II flippase
MQVSQEFILSRWKANILGVLRRDLVKDTIWTTIFSVIGKGFGFLIPFFIAAWFGITSETDAFFFAYGLILFLSVIFAPVVESVIVPYIAEARAKDEDIGAFVGSLLGISALGLLALTAIVLLVIKPILSVITRFDSNALDLVYLLLIESSPLVILLVCTSILAGTLNAHKKFAFPALSPGFRAVVNLCIIFAFKDSYGVHAIAIGYVAGEIVRLSILIVLTIRSNLFRLGLSFQFTPRLREFFRTASYQTIGMAAVGLNPVVDVTMASWLGKGSVSVLEYAYRLYMIPANFVVSGLMVTLLSHWSGRYYESGRQRLNDDVNKIVKLVGVISLLITGFLIFIHQPLVAIAYGRGAFDTSRLSEVGWAWVCFLFGFVPYMIGTVFLRAHVILKNTKVIMKYGFISVGLNVLFNYLLMKHFRVTGIALATTFTHLFFVIYLRMLFYRDVNSSFKSKVANEKNILL